MSSSALTAEQAELVNRYASYSESELYNLIGNLCDEYGNAGTREQYSLGVPNVFQRGKAFVGDMRVKVAAVVCPQHQRINQYLTAKKDSLQPVEWAGVLIDVGLSVTVTGGVPPLAVAIAVGKLCNYSVGTLCKGSPPEGGAPA